MARREISLPAPPQMPTKLPFEDSLSRGVDKVLSLMEKDPLLKLVNGAVEKIPIIPEREFPTPLGNYRTPEFYIPKISPATMDSRQREAFKAAALSDMAKLIGAIPVLGAVAEPLADSIEDTASAKINDTLTDEEYAYYKSYDKVDPLSVIAMIRTMVRTQKER